MSSNLSNQELFAKGLATYQKVEAANYMAHREVYGLLHDALMDARAGFVFADLGCGTATGSASALAGTPVGRYVGVDISEQSLDVAREALGGLTCPIELRLEDFPAAIQNWQGPLDVVWIGQSLHHLRAPEKRVFMRRVADLLPANGLFLIWEPTCLEGEDREGWMDASVKCVPTGPLFRTRNLPHSIAITKRPTTLKLLKPGRRWRVRLASPRRMNSSRFPTSSRGCTDFAMRTATDPEGSNLSMWLRARWRRSTWLR